MGEIKPVFYPLDGSKPYVMVPQDIENRLPQDTLDDKTTFLYLDGYSDRLFFAWDMGNRIGANMIIVENLPDSAQELFEQLETAIYTSRVHNRILPFHSLKGIPIYNDDGEQGLLTITHLPDVQLTPLL